MVSDKSAKSGLFKKMLKIVFGIFFSLSLVIFLWQTIWKMSGSNQWELIRQEQGIEVYSLKAPGSSLKQIRAKVRVKASMASIVSFFQDQSTCPEFGCLEAEIIEQVSPQLYYSSFKYPLPFNLGVREFVVKSVYYQDPVNKEVHYYHTAAPEMKPLDDCCFRVTDFYVLWRFTPVGKGEVELEMKRDFDLGGFMPDLLLNQNFPGGAYNLLARLQGFLDREKYQGAAFDFIREPASEVSLSPGS